MPKEKEEVQEKEDRKAKREKKKKNIVLEKELLKN